MRSSSDGSSLGKDMVHSCPIRPCNCRTAGTLRHGAATQSGNAMAFKRSGRNRMRRIEASLVGLSLLALAGLPALAQGSIPMDQPTTVGTVDTVCTGIGDDAQH